MLTLSADDPLAVAAVDPIRAGEVERLRRLLDEHPDLATARVIGRSANDDKCDGDERSRTLLGVVTEWPGHFPHGAAIVELLARAGADLDAACDSAHAETPLHWAASSDDIEVLDALIDAGADVEAPGAVIAGGTPLDDAVAFGQWRAARRLAERGAQTALWHAAALGLMDRVAAHFEGDPLPARHPWGASGDAPPPDAVTVALWCACHGGQRQTAAYLLTRGAELNWVSGWDGLTPLDTAKREATETARPDDYEELIAWLHSQGAKSAVELS
jgi:uncharacterized protein